MRTNRARWLVALFAFLLLALLVTYGAGYRIDYYSCHKCRNLRRVRAHTFLWWAVSQSESVDGSHPVEPGHEHEWWHYGTFRQSGLWGTFHAFEAGPQQYRDGWQAPVPSDEPPVTPPKKPKAAAE